MSQKRCLFCFENKKYETERNLVLAGNSNVQTSFSLQPDDVTL